MLIAAAVGANQRFLVVPEGAEMSVNDSPRVAIIRDRTCHTTTAHDSRHDARRCDTAQHGTRHDTATVRQYGVRWCVAYGGEWRNWPSDNSSIQERWRTVVALSTSRGVFH